MNQRYQRSPVVPQQNATVQSASPQESDVKLSAGTPNAEQFQELTKRLEVLRDRRRRHEYELDRAEREVAECQTQAKALGVTTLEELEALVERQEAEDREAIAKFMAALDAEEALLNEIDQRLAGNVDA